MLSAHRFEASASVLLFIRVRIKGEELCTLSCVRYEECALMVLLSIKFGDKGFVELVLEELGLIYD